MVNKNRLSMTLVPYSFIAPVIILLFVFNILPLFSAFGLSCFDVSITLEQPKFVGLDNFAEIFGDNRFWNSLAVTLKWTVVEVPLQVVLALLLSALLTQNNLVNKIFRGIYFLPIVCSATVTGIMWKLILHSNVGYITYLLRIIGFDNINFMNSPKITFFVIVFMSIWKTFGISVVIFVGAMQNVPKSLYEAAEMDNAGKLRQFLSVTIPGIMPTLWFIIITRLISSFQVFDIVYTTTGGGPNFSTETLVTYIYTRAFEVYRMGYASAVSVCLFIIILIITIVTYTGMLKQEKDY
ncbi:carbohydrate ABC transporter permease [Ruminiclostridium cellobioparum]|jgi:multiple sugar transport system permease protein|uniref:carbohydrate ABC transporter permease n=1 Tax=Ruminiclostridium cellobioparum TaxID=29355 RepID=UPI000687A12A|nr:sugar ABC transporter permease [Ruminiclostridium cellobioparum]